MGAGEGRKLCGAVSGEGSVGPLWAAERGTGRDVEEATREQPRGGAHREQSGWSYFFILSFFFFFSGSGCILKYTELVFKIFFLPFF